MTEEEIAWNFGQFDAGAGAPQTRPGDGPDAEGDIEMSDVPSTNSLGPTGFVSQPGYYGEHYEESNDPSDTIFVMIDGECMQVPGRPKMDQNGNGVL